MDELLHVLNQIKEANGKPIGYKIIRISDHSIGGSSGELRVEADSEEACLAGMHKVLDEYPVNPYGTIIKHRPHLKPDGKWSCTIEHWGAD